MDSYFFSTRDDSLIRKGPVRDYLGLQVVWSSVARQFEPHLSGQVTNINGITAIGLIYYIINRSSSEEIQDAQSNFLKLMEGLFEFHRSHCMKASPLYGARTIKSNADVLLSFNSGIVVRGLSQYYRGTCKRSGMLEADWGLDSEWDQLFSEKVTESVIEEINAVFKGVNEQRDIGFRPSEIFELHTEIKSLFDSVFADDSFHFLSYYKGKLFGDEQQALYANACANDSDLEEADCEGRNRLRRIYDALDQDSAPGFHRQDDLQQYLWCEPFLCFISDAFHLISSLECLSQFTEVQCFKEHTNIINEKASNFLKLQSSQPAEIQKKRFSALFYLAELAKESDWHTFATELVANYHCQVMQGRGLDPLVSLEGEKIVTTDDLGSYPVKELEKRLLSETVSANSYFVHATAAIYKSVSREVS